MLSYFVSNNDVSETLPRGFIIKYTQQLLDIRIEIFEKMKAHNDKYNGSCLNHEKIREFDYDGIQKGYLRPNQKENPVMNNKNDENIAVSQVNKASCFEVKMKLSLGYSRSNTVLRRKASQYVYDEVCRVFKHSRVCRKGDNQSLL